jgi:hypothetical protein
MYYLDLNGSAIEDVEILYVIVRVRHDSDRTQYTVSSLEKKNKKGRKKFNY